MVYINKQVEAKLFKIFAAKERAHLKQVISLKNKGYFKPRPNDSRVFDNLKKINIKGFSNILNLNLLSEFF